MKITIEIKENKSQHIYSGKATFDNHDKVVLKNSDDYTVSGSVRLIEGAEFRHKQYQFRTMVADLLNGVMQEVYDISKTEEIIKNKIEKEKNGIYISNEEASELLEELKYAISLGNRYGINIKNALKNTIEALGGKQ